MYTAKLMESTRVVKCLASNIDYYFKLWGFRRCDFVYTANPCIRKFESTIFAHCELSVSLPYHFSKLMESTRVVKCLASNIDYYFNLSFEVLGDVNSCTEQN